MSHKTDRRQLFKILGAAPLAAAAMAQEKAAAPAATPAAAPAAAYKPKVLSAHEYRTTRILADLIIPADDHSGNASQAGVPEFIDGVLAVRGGRIQSQIRGGLVWLDREATHRFQKDFADCSVAQQKEILDLIAYPKKAAPEHSQAVVFFNRFRDLVAGGFYSSKIGTKDLGYMGNVAVMEWNGCPDEALKKLGLA
jgi:hypothetical protein